MKGEEEEMESRRLKKKEKRMEKKMGREGRGKGGMAIERGFS